MKPRLLERRATMNFILSKSGFRARWVPCVLIAAACGGRTLFAGGTSNKEEGAGGEAQDDASDIDGDQAVSEPDAPFFDVGYFTSCGDVQCDNGTFCVTAIGGQGDGNNYYACRLVPDPCHGLATCACAGSDCENGDVVGAYECEGVMNNVMTCVPAHHG
jgi:hypothetical protein